MGLWGKFQNWRVRRARLSAWLKRGLLSKRYAAARPSRLERQPLGWFRDFNSLIEGPSG